MCSCMNDDHSWIGADNIIVNEEGKILLMRRSDNSKTYPNCWGLFLAGWSGVRVLRML